jgi:rhodanese-related sulfurtransferase
MDNLEFETLTAEEFDEYVKKHKEKEYLLIDVRQESEYELGHIPGARLMPLAEVETRLFSLPADQDLIFYCQNGGRSQWAASLAGASEVCQKKVYHLMGGLLVRNGKILPGYPKIKIFEYAAFDLYRAMAQQSEHSETREAFLAIAQAEKGHMRALARSIEKCQ